MTWLDNTNRLDLTGSKGNGPFSRFLGVVLHVNVDETGTSDSFFAAGPPTNPDDVCPNFQVYKNGTIHEYLPLDWQPWCQAGGNANYAAIETAGMPNEPLTAAQVASCGRIVAAYHAVMGMPLQLANAPGQQGLGTHSMGGAAWGGHSCPGDIRAAQRTAILAAASGQTPTGGFLDMLTDQQQTDLYNRIMQAPVQGLTVKMQQAQYNQVINTGKAVNALVGSLNPDQLAAAIAKALPSQGDLTQAQIEQAIRDVLGSLNDQETS